MRVRVRVCECVCVRVCECVCVLGGGGVYMGVYVCVYARIAV